MGEKKEKKIKNLSFVQFLRVLGMEGFLFLLTLILGVFSAQRIIKILELTEVSLPKVSLWDFFFYFLLITAFVVFLTLVKRFQRAKSVVYKSIFVLAVFGGGVMILSVWLTDIPALIIMGFLIYFWFKKPKIYLHNLVIILGLAGAGSLLGLQLTPEIVIILLVVFSIYDFIAVYKTKHMVKMAKEMIKKEVILGFVVSLSLSDFSEKIEKVKPGGQFLILGGGDVAFPLLLAASLVRESILSSLIVVGFSLLGLFLSFLLFSFQKVRAPIPALPPIALFSVIGYLITRLI